MTSMRFAIGCLSGGALFLALPSGFCAPIPEDCQIGGFAIGCQAYTFTRFTLLRGV